jgi:hypothetical protein
MEGKLEGTPNVTYLYMNAGNEYKHQKVSRDIHVVAEVRNSHLPGESIQLQNYSSYQLTPQIKSK